MDRMVPLGLRGHKVNKGFKDRLDHKDPLAPMGRTELLDRKDRRVNRGRKDPLGPKDQPVRMG